VVVDQEIIEPKTPLSLCRHRAESCPCPWEITEQIHVLSISVDLSLKKDDVVVTFFALTFNPLVFIVHRRRG